MLTLDQVFKKDELKFSKLQINNALYKYGHITKEEKEYLDKKDVLDLLKKKKKAKYETFLINNITVPKSSLKHNSSYLDLKLSKQEVNAI